MHSQLWSPRVRLGRCWALVCGAMVTAAAPSVAFAQTLEYRALDLGVFYVATSLNEAGEMVGANADGQAVLYSRGALRDLGTLSGKSEGVASYTFAADINNRGTVVGLGNVRSEGGGQLETHAFRYANGRMVDLDARPGFTVSGALDVNDAGHITGYASFGNPETWSPFILRGGSFVDLGSLGGRYGSGAEINSHDTIVGSSEISVGGPTHAFMYDGTMHDLGTLGGSASQATAINDVGTIVGTAALSDGRTHAVIWSNGTAIDLDPNGAYSDGIDINESGVVVASVSFEGGGTRAAVWKDGAMTDLNTLLAGPRPPCVLDQAVAINDGGQIGTVCYVGNDQHVFLLTPVPEPGALTLFAAGLLALGATARRRHEGMG